MVFMGSPKSAPIDGILPDIYWLLPQSKGLLKIIQYYHKLINLDSNRLTKRIFRWDRKLSDSGTINTWT